LLKRNQRRGLRLQEAAVIGPPRQVETGKHPIDARVGVRGRCAKELPGFLSVLDGDFCPTARFRLRPVKRT